MLEKKGNAERRVRYGWVLLRFSDLVLRVPWRENLQNSAGWCFTSSFLYFDFALFFLGWSERRRKILLIEVGDVLPVSALSYFYWCHMICGLFVVFKVGRKCLPENFVIQPTSGIS